MRDKQKLPMVIAFRHDKLELVRRNSRWVCRSTVLALAAYLLFAPRSACADTISVTSTEDSTIEQGSPDSNFGTSVTAISGKLGTFASGEVRHALFKFDLNGKIPAGASITSVNLQVQVVRVPLSPANSTFDLRRVLQNW